MKCWNWIAKSNKKIKRIVTNGWQFINFFSLLVAICSECCVLWINITWLNELNGAKIQLDEVAPGQASKWILQIFFFCEKWKIFGVCKRTTEGRKWRKLNEFFFHLHRRLSFYLLALHSELFHVEILTMWWKCCHDCSATQKQGNKVNARLLMDTALSNCYYSK